MGRARKTPPPTIRLIVDNDYGTEELRKRAHSIFFEQPDPNSSAKRLRVEADIISWYLRRHYLSQFQADALRKFQTDAYLAGLMPSCTSNYQQAIAGSGELSDNRIAAQQRRGHTIDFLRTVDRQAVELIEAVAVRDQPAGRYMLTNYGLPPNEALKMLVKFSTALAKHLGLIR